MAEITPLGNESNEHMIKLQNCNDNALNNNIMLQEQPSMQQQKRMNFNSLKHSDPIVEDLGSDNRNQNDKIFDFRDQLKQMGINQGDTPGGEEEQKKLNVGQDKPVDRSDSWRVPPLKQSDKNQAKLQPDGLQVSEEIKQDKNCSKNSSKKLDDPNDKNSVPAMNQAAADKFRGCPFFGGIKRDEVPQVLRKASSRMIEEIDMEEVKRRDSKMDEAQERAVRMAMDAFVTPTPGPDSSQKGQSDRSVNQQAQCPFAHGNNQNEEMKEEADAGP